MNPCKNIILIVALSLTYFGQLAAQSPGLKLDHIWLEQGLSQSTVNAIAQDSKGFMWFGTGRGPVHHYALGTWESFNVSDDLVGRTVWRICETTETNGEQAIWFATNHGLSEFVGGKWITFTKQDGLVGDIAYDSCKSTDGSLWVGTERGV